ncbi:MAG: hypothetical protein IPL78_15480 [Chloroflexi bacterium]|nr:hypothetical protein [Chloroflexota bacterium]
MLSSSPVKPDNGRYTLVNSNIVLSWHLIEAGVSLFSQQRMPILDIAIRASDLSWIKKVVTDPATIWCVTTTSLTSACASFISWTERGRVTGFGYRQTKLRVWGDVCPT